MRIHSDIMTDKDFLRLSDRLDIRKSDGIKSFVNVNEIEKVQVEIFNISPFGCSVRLPLGISLSLGQTVNFEIHFPDFQQVIYVSTVLWKKDIGGSLRVGFEFNNQISPLASIAPLNREEFPVVIPDYFKVSLTLYKPYLFFERSLISVIEFSSQIWLCELYDTELILFKGQIINVWLLNYEDEKSSIYGEVIEVHKVGTKRILIQMKINKVSSKVTNWLAHQLVLNCNFSPLIVRKLGFETKEFSNGFRFRFVKTTSEYESVLKLRFKSYLDAGKIDSSKSWTDMKAPLDHLSRILIAFHGEKLVASVSISYPDSEDCVLDTEKVYPNGYPVKVPDKRKIVEISRLCTDSEYRRTDLLNRVFEYTYKSVLCGDRDFILTSTDVKLWTLYKKLGFKKTGMSYPHPYLSGIEHFIIIGKRSQPDYGADISPLAWNYLWREMNDYMIDRQILKHSLIEYVNILFYKFIGKILKIQRKKFY